MPNLRESLSDNFEGSAFVWKEFKRNPVLSVLGLPFVLLEAALLPVRAVTNRKDVVSHDIRYQLQFGAECHDPPLDGSARYQTDSPGGDGDHGYGVPLYGSHTQTEVQAYSNDLNRNRDHRGKRQRANKEFESVLYPGWRLPHHGFAARPTYSADAEHGTMPPSEHKTVRDSRGTNHGGSRSLSRSRPTPLDRRRNYHPQPAWHRYQNPPSIQTQTLQDPYLQSYDQPLQAPSIQENFVTAGNQRHPGTAEYAGLPHLRGIYVPPTVASAQSGSQSRNSITTQPTHVLSTRSSGRSRTGTARSGMVNNEDGDRDESYIDQSYLTHGSHRSRRSRQTWKPPPSSIHTLKQFRPTDREDSVAPWDSASQQPAPAESEDSFEELPPAQVPAKTSKAPSRRSGGPATVERASQRTRQSSRSRSGMLDVPQPGANPPSRSQSITTINTADLPDTVHTGSRTQSTVTRARSHRMATAASRAHEPIVEEPDSDEESRGYCTTCAGPHVPSDHDADAIPGAFPQATSRAGNGGWQMPQETHAHPLQGPMPGMQSQDFGMSVQYTHHPSNYGGASHHAPSRSSSRRRD